MALIGNYSLLHKSPAKYLTGTVGYCDPANWNKSGMMASRCLGTLAAYDSVPAGFAAGKAIYPPKSMGRCVTRSPISVNGAASGAMGMPGTATSVITITGISVGGLITGGVATATMTIAGHADGAGLAAGEASGMIAFDGHAALGAVAWGVSNGVLSINGAVKPFALAYGKATTVDSSALTPAAIAKAVWESLLTEYAESGTAGKALGMASSGGVDMDALAEAVWQHTDAQAMATRLAEAWGRLGLDPSAPLVTGQTSITFGDIVMAMTGDDTSTTVTRQ